jgi:predicted phosphodiesterase
MRIAVFSDVHGNLDALEAVLGEVDRLAADAVWVLGDLVGGPRSAAAADLVQAEATIVVAGDRDVAAVRGELEEADHLLAPGQLLWLAGLPLRERNWKAELVHSMDGAGGSGRRVAAAALAACEEPFLVAGHTGQAAVYSEDAHGTVTGGAVERAGWVDISRGRFLLNPGAVAGDHVASWLMIDTGQERAEFNQIEW